MKTEKLVESKETPSLKLPKYRKSMLGLLRICKMQDLREMVEVSELAVRFLELPIIYPRSVEFQQQELNPLLILFHKLLADIRAPINLAPSIWKTTTVSFQTSRVKLTSGMLFRNIS